MCIRPHFFNHIQIETVINFISLRVILLPAERTISHFNRYHGLTAICERERGLAGCTPGCRSVGLQYSWELFWPVTLGPRYLGLEGVLDDLLKASF